VGRVARKWWKQESLAGKQKYEDHLRELDVRENITFNHIPKQKEVQSLNKKLNNPSTWQYGGLY
jgi:hypothetical protein